MTAKVDIFSGFLGSGKTMLIKKLLNENSYKSNTVILENEFGEVSIDGELLKEHNLVIKEINAGCICCQVSGDFSTSLMDILNNYEPDNIIIEPSGVAKLSAVINTLKAIKFSGRLEMRNIITLIDINNFDYYIKNFKEFYIDQIKNAEKIVLTRIDENNMELQNSVVNKIKEINNSCMIFRKSYEKLKSIELLKKYENLKKYEFHKNITNYIKVVNNKNNFQSIKIHVKSNISEDELKNKFNFINENKFGNVLRAKGIVKNLKNSFYVFDYVKGEFNTKNIKWSNKNVISIIGNDLNERKLRNLFE